MIIDRAGQRDIWFLCLSAAVLIVATGCGSVPRKAGFDDVQNMIAERTGARVHWSRGGDEDREVQNAIDTLLAEPLMAAAAVQIALLNNRDLQATYEDLMIAQADLVAAGLLRNPVFSAEIKFIEAGGGTNLDFGIVQSFLEILYIPLRQRVAGAQFEAARQEVTASALDLVRQTRIEFYMLQAAEQRLEMQSQVLAATAASYELAHRLREAGNITELDLANERALHEETKLNFAAAEAQTFELREGLNSLMGTWGNQTYWTIASRLPEPPALDPSAEDAERMAVSRNVQLAAAEQRIAAAGARLGIAGPEATFADAQIGIAAEREGDGAWSLGPAFAVPLPLWSQGRPAIAAAEAELRRARQLHNAAAVRLRAQTRAAHIRMSTARERLEYQRLIILPLRQRIVEESMLQYNAMQIGTFQLLTARKEQIRSGAAYIETLRDYWVARADLEWLVGGDLTTFVDSDSPAKSEAAGELESDANQNQSQPESHQ